jgi:hypothetical protein
MATLRLTPLLTMILSFLAILVVPARHSFASTAGSLLLSLGETNLRYDYGGRPQLGIDLSGGSRRLPVWVAAYAAASYDVRYCNDESCKAIHESTREAGVGLRGVWSTRRLHASIGAGPAWGRYHIELERPDFGVRSRYDYHGSGWWANAAALFRASGHLGLGGGVRYSRLDSAYRGLDLEAWTFHGTIGWLWPGAEE